MDILKFYITQSEQDKTDKTATLTVESDLGYGRNNSTSTFLKDFQSPDFFKLKSELSQLFNWVINHYEAKYHAGVHERALPAEVVSAPKIIDIEDKDSNQKLSKMKTKGTFDPIFNGK